MISVHLMGGLGNQLFQIFALLAYALENRRTCLFQYMKLSPGGRQKRYWYNIFSAIRGYAVPRKIQFDLYMEPAFHYTPIPKDLRQPFKLSGYFQSERYFIKQYSKIIRILKIRDKQTALREANKGYFREGKSHISLHFRIGDYMEVQNRGIHPVMPVTYYVRALKWLSKSIKGDTAVVLYFCEKGDEKRVSEMVEVLGRAYPSMAFLKASDELDDWEQMLLMSCCDHHIIGNSSFSWWGAYFNSSREKIVCYPSIWFGPKLAHHDIKDLCPGSWKVIRI